MVEAEDENPPRRNTLNKGDNGDTSNVTSDSASRELEENHKSQKTYKLYPVRWAICIFFTTLLASTGLGQIGFAAIAKVIKNTYGVNDLTITFIVLPFIILFIPMIFPANYCYDRFGIRVPIIIAAFMCIIGAWTRQFVNYSFYFFLGGQVIQALGQPFILSAPAKVAAIWFGDDERALATMIGSLAGPFGAATGYVLPLPLISDDDAPPVSSQEHAEKIFFRYVLINNIIMTVGCLPIIFLIRNAPPTPPSASAEKLLKSKKVGQMADICNIMKNRDFIIVLFSFSCIYCIYTTLGAAVGPLSEQFGYGSSDNSIFGLSFLVTGLVGSFIHAFLLDKFKKFKLQFIMIGVLCVVAMGLISALINKSNVYITAACIAFLGFAQLPIIGVSYAFTSELTYPVNEALSCGFLQLSGSVVASIFTFVVGYLLDQNHKYAAVFAMVGISFVGCLPAPFVREILKKTRAGHKNKSFSFYQGNTSFVEDPEPQGQGALKTQYSGKGESDQHKTSKEALLDNTL